MSRDLLFRGPIVMWRCPVCGEPERDTGQSSRYCGRTKDCTTAKRGGRIEMTRMERWEYTPTTKIEAS